ncbi:MAG TPA: phosphate ABC transporter substrate-binding protein PstS [Capsulimonadaceae bacterium]|jgi:phosphate transport system substrate-binding protein
MFRKNSSLTGSLLKIAAPAIAVAAGIMSVPAAQAQTITGAGATFPAPIIQKWIGAYKASTGVEVNYQPIGSGGGINALISHTVDFAGSDIPMNANEKGQAGAPVVNIPDIIGAVVVCYNLSKIGPGIALTGPVIADIFQGKITYWDDPRITKLSPGVKFPHDNIIVVHRSDGSGTTAIFTDYLSKVSSSWKSEIGTGKSVSWPSGQLGGKGNAGVAGFVTTHDSTIGYVELAYAIQKNIPYAQVENKAGKLIYPTDEAASAAADGVKVPANLEFSITNSANAKAYPIAGVSNLIVYAKSPKNAEVKKFFKFILTEGQKPEYTEPLHYSPLPDGVAAKALEAVEKLR